MKFALQYIVDDTKLQYSHSMQMFSLITSEVFEAATSYIQRTTEYLKYHLLIIMSREIYDESDDLLCSAN